MAETASSTAIDIKGSKSTSNSRLWVTIEGEAASQVAPLFRFFTWASGEEFGENAQLKFCLENPHFTHKEPSEAPQIGSYFKLTSDHLGWHEAHQFALQDGALDREDYPATLLVGLDVTEPSLNVNGPEWSRYRSDLPYSLSVNVKTIAGQGRDTICSLAPCLVTIDQEELRWLSSQLEDAEELLSGQMELTNPWMEAGERDVMISGNPTWVVLCANPTIHPTFRPPYGWMDLLEQGFLPSFVAGRTDKREPNESAPQSSTQTTGALLRAAQAQHPLLDGRESAIIAKIKGGSFAGLMRRLGVRSSRAKSSSNEEPGREEEHTE